MSGPAEHSPRVVLGVGGGIAAYKACEVLRGLTETGHDVRVVPTAAALRFVGAATWSALSGHPVAVDVFADAHEVPHVRIGREADLVLVVPATADLLGRAAHGLADDLLTSTLLTATCPVVMAPAMHSEMWDHPATRANVELLRARGVLVVEPAVGRLTGADTGRGRLPEPGEIVRIARAALTRGSAPTAGPDLAGRHVLVTAGGTHEHLDPVRFLGNRSSGRQGYALAATAVARGARVTLVAANVALPDPAGAQVHRVASAADLRAAVQQVLAAAPPVDAVVMAAAVADFRPASVAPSKVKKGAGPPAPLVLEPTVDVLRELVTRRGGAALPLLVGFAAETGDDTGSVLDHGRAKLSAKGCDLLVVNEVGPGVGFGSEDNAAVVLGADGSRRDVPLGPKAALADAVWDLVAARLGPTDGHGGPRNGAPPG